MKTQKLPPGLITITGSSISNMITITGKLFPTGFSNVRNVQNAFRTFLRTISNRAAPKELLAAQLGIWVIGLLAL